MNEPVLVLDGVVEPEDVPGLCERLRAMLERGHTRVTVYDVGGLRRPDAAAVDALARLQLTARRGGSRVVLRSASPELASLLDLAGLGDVVPAGARSGVPGDSSLQVGRHTEDGEQPGVEEVRDADDPAL